MSFFHLKRKPEKPVKDNVALLPSARKHAPALHRLGCQGCPLNNTPCHTPKMVPTLGGIGGIYFLAEAPGSNEDEHSGSPLTGPSGTLLRQCLPSSNAAALSFDNIINCRPPNNRTPTWQEAECCRPRRIKWVEQVKPKLIVGLGAVPLQWALNSTDIGGMRGRLFAIKVGNHECWYLPTYHPSFILRIAHDKRKPLQSKLGHCFKQDIKKAFDVVGRLKPMHIDSEAEIRSNIVTFNGKTFSKLKQLLHQAAAAPVKAIDIETQGLRPYNNEAAILSVAISCGPLNFAFAVDHPKQLWQPEERTAILEMLRAILIDDTIKIAHNAPFELEWFIWLYGKEIVNHAAFEDTQVQAHFLDERRGKRGGRDDDHRAPYQNLNFLCRMHFGVPFKALFKLNKKDMARSDLNEMLIYNAVDTKYTLKLWNAQNKLLKQQGLEQAYREALPRQPTVALIQAIGIEVNQQERARLGKLLDAELAPILAEISQLGVVKQFAADHKVFRPSSNDDVLRLFRDYLKVKNLKSVDKNDLNMVDHPLANLVIHYRNRSKLRSTYVDPFELGKGAFVNPDGKIHCNFNTTFAETGRTSCVAEWTTIVTKRGVIQIRHIKIGDQVWTHKKRWQAVTALWRKGIKPMYDVYLGNGQILTCTKNHRVLLSTGQWVAIEDLNGIFDQVGEEPTKHSEGIEPVQIQGTDTYKDNCLSARNKAGKYLSGNKRKHAEARKAGTSSSSLFGIKAWGQEPYAWQSAGAAPEVEGSLPRGQGLFNYKTWFKTYIFTPLRNYAGIEVNHNAYGLGSASHRWGPIQQRHKQPSVSDRPRPQSYSLQAARNESVEIEAIKACGSFEVFDITVEQDASYYACGVFSHNSDSPNMQNFPQRADAWIRSQIVAPKGHVMVAFDYGQLEGCTAAMCSKDKTLIDALWKDYDIHMAWAAKVAKQYPAIGTVDKQLRAKIKNKWVFPLIFGASNESIAGYLNMPIEVVDDLIDEFWQQFHGLKNWQDKTMKKYYETGYVESPTGRRHRYPLTRNQVINFPIQSVACDIMCRSMIDLSIMAAETQQWHLHPVLTIHDDLTFMIPNNDQVLEESIEAIYTVMLTPPFSFINVPLSVKVMMGPNWFDMQEIGQFKSNEDL